MIETRLTFVAAVAVVFVLGVIVELIRRHRLQERYALLWIATGGVMLVLAIWRQALDGFAHLIGVAYPPSALFMVAGLFVFVVLLHYRRRIVHFNVTEHPTAVWTAQQVVEAFPDDTAPRWLLRDRDAIYGEAFRRRVAGIGIEEVLSGPSSPWQNPYAERLIGSVRRDCLNHIVVLGEEHLRRVLAGHFAYYHGSRTHLALAKDTPTPRRVQGVTEGEVIGFREVGGLHHRYERRAA